MSEDETLRVLVSISQIAGDFVVLAKALLSSLISLHVARNSFLTS